MIREVVRQLIDDAVQRAQEDHALPPVAVPEVTVERPASEAHGDYASSLALKMARAARLSPMAIAGAIATHMAPPPSIAAVDVAAPGFINIRLSPQWLAQQVDVVLEAGPAFASTDVGRGRRVQVEYVSANPTGPLHVGTARGAALGDSLARVLQQAGYEVEREYYVNDAGSRMDAFNASLYARYAEQFGVDIPIPEDGYPGEYLRDVAAAIAATEGRRLLDIPEGEALLELGRRGVEIILAGVRDDLERLNVRFDSWFHEQWLYDHGLVDRALAFLRERGYVVEREGAIWFTSSSLGEDKDNVLVRSNGLPTYFASDVAYHYDKLVRRSYDRAIDVWGADHQGHVPRMRAVVGALEADPSRLVILLYQLVNLVRQGRPIAMGKRTGSYITLREVLDEVGPDAIRFFLLGRSPDAMMDFDLDLAKAQSDVNPVYYVQYAYARIASIMRRAEGTAFASGDVSLLTHGAELALIRKMLALPEVVADAAFALAPHTLPYYAQELATAFHAFYKDCRVISDDLDLTRARLKLVAACQTMLATTLGLIGVRAPEHM
ncbi:MAG: arginine--tRNA ligase [Chloroflexi bacterium]|nr:arginine--tRNA ligase [Chloroflexota bacterium]